MTRDIIGQADLAFQSNLYESGNPTRRWIHRRRHEWVIGKLRQYSPIGEKTAFDCGVGCGIYSRVLVSMGMSVVAIDVNEKFVDAARSIPGVAPMVADICRPDTLPVQANVSLAVCSEVLEHVPDPDAALRSLHGVLAPGGILVLTTPQKWSTTELVARLLKIGLVERLARAIYKEPVEDLGHISLLSRGQLQRKLRERGFEILEHEVLSFYLPVVAEFGGRWGQRLLSGLEKFLRACPPLRWMVWTQCYVLRRP